MIERILEYIVKALVRNKQDVLIKRNDTGSRNVIKVYVNPDDVGKVLGHNGKTANSIRAVCSAFAGRYNRVRIDFETKEYEDIEAKNDGKETVSVQDNVTTLGEDIEIVQE